MEEEIGVKFRLEDADCNKADCSIARRHVRVVEVLKDGRRRFFKLSELEKLPIEKRLIQKFLKARELYHKVLHMDLLIDKIKS